MNRLVAALLIALCAMTCMSAETNAASGHPVSAAQPQDATLYRAAFTHSGLKGWVTRRWVPEGWIPQLIDGPSRRDWTVNRQGIATFHGENGGDNRAGDLFAPYQIRNVRDYAVQAEIKGVGKPWNPFEGGYGLVIGDAGRRPHVLLGGFLGLSTPEDGLDSVLAWHGVEVLGGAASSMHRGFNTYRLEVHNTDYTLSINGQQIVQFTITDFENGTRVGLWDSYQNLQIRSFTVTRLPVATPLPSLPPVQALDLTPTDLGADRSDVPSSLSSLPGQYYTTEGASRDHQIPIARLTSQGFLIEYERDYGCCTGQTGDESKATGPFVVTGVVDAFSSSQGVQQALADDWAVEHQRLSPQPNYTGGAITNLGDQAYELSADFSDQYLGTIAGAEVIFRRGPYVVTVQASSLPRTVPRTELITQTAALARIVDGRILQQKARA